VRVRDCLLARFVGGGEFIAPLQKLPFKWPLRSGERQNNAQRITLLRLAGVGWLPARVGGPEQIPLSAFLCALTHTLSVCKLVCVSVAGGGSFLNLQWHNVEAKQRLRPARSSRRRPRRERASERGKGRTEARCDGKEPKEDSRRQPSPRSARTRRSGHGPLKHHFPQTESTKIRSGRRAAGGRQALTHRPCVQIGQPDRRRWAPIKSKSRVGERARGAGQNGESGEESCSLICGSYTYYHTFTPPFSRKTACNIKWQLCKGGLF
jgi:hypothetical protein